MAMVTCILLAILFIVPLSNAEITKKRVERIFNDYDPAVTGTQESVQVRLGVYVNTFILDEDEGTLFLKIYLRQSWKDARLTKYFDDLGADIKTVLFKYNIFSEGFWLPDTFIRNGMDVNAHQTGSTYESLFRVNRTGHVWYVHSLSIKMACPDLLNTYSVVRPQIQCEIYFESFSYTSKSIYYTWLSNPVSVNPSASPLLRFTVSNTTVQDCSQTYTAGTFPCLKIIFTVDHSHGVMMLDAGVYVLSFFFVLVSWYAFWMDPSHGFLPRLSFGVNVIFTLGVYSLAMVMWYGKNGVGSYALSKWLLGCWMFSLLPLLELGLVYVVLTLIPDRLALAKGNNISVTTKTYITLDENQQDGRSKSQVTLLNKEVPMGYPRWVALVDTLFGLILMPVTFVIFNIAYWSAH